ncbi:hypothetical protein PP640_gp30 [Arthrobacter phage Faja]|uniref:Uncharacterized protein n=1 Tax=Arthrobacter phage Faja TaxID=2419957 RepID=A0A3G2KFX1_9CAUD|nr:hypothetical protein PP640_gp30 [Arthrobacter phage Faja]AYN57883.1 hypothetical protein PBI_FAJA_30 [Arthrobacter phage Faja]
MSDFLAPPGITRAGLDTELASKITDPDSDTAGALNATFVRFEDEAGNPLPNRNVVIKVDSTTGEIIDIVSEV